VFISAVQRHQSTSLQQTKVVNRVINRQYLACYWEILHKEHWFSAWWCCKIAIWV